MLLQEHTDQDQQHLRCDHLMQPAEPTHERGFDLCDHDAADPICRSSSERDSASASSGELRHEEPDPTDLLPVSASATIPTLDELRRAYGWTFEPRSHRAPTPFLHQSSAASVPFHGQMCTQLEESRSSMADAGESLENASSTAASSSTWLSAQELKQDQEQQKVQEHDHDHDQHLPQQPQEQSGSMPHPSRPYYPFPPMDNACGDSMALPSSYLAEPYYPNPSPHASTYVFTPQNLQCTPADPSSSLLCNPRQRSSVPHYPLHSYYSSSVMLPQYQPSYNNLSNLSNDHSYSYYNGSYPAMERFRRTCSNDPAPLSSSGSAMSSLLDRAPTAAALAANHGQLPTSFPPFLAFTARPSSGFPSALASNADGSVFDGKQLSQDPPKARRSLTKHELHAMDPDPNQKLHGRPRPFFKAKDGTIKIHRTLPDHTPCAICGTTQTPIWRKRPNNTVICNGCSLISKQSRAFEFGHEIEAQQQQQQQQQQPFPSPPQSAHSAGSAVYAPGKKTRQRSRAKGSVASAHHHKDDEDDEFGNHKRFRPRHHAITEVEPRTKQDDAAQDFYAGCPSEIGAGTAAAAVNSAPAGAAFNANGPHRCNGHSGYGSCSCSHYLGVSGGTCRGGRLGQNDIASGTETSSSSSSLPNMPLDASFIQ
ncbi:unnamed protein product [Mortierella alpina]